MQNRMKAFKNPTSQNIATKEKVYFFSDAHLGLGSTEDDRKREQHLLRFLEFVERDAKQLFIVGDLFDYWFEYRTVVPKGYFRLFSKLAELTERGIRISFIAGNHDFWVKSYFHEELGMEVYSDPIEEKINGKRFLIHHGDGLLKGDTGYTILKKILRNKVNIFLFSLIHPDITGYIARWSSRTSRQYTGNRTYESDGMITFATQKIKEGFDFVVMGHNHIPSYKKIGNGVYVNLGDWIVQNTYAIFDGRKLELNHWTD